MCTTIIIVTLMLWSSAARGADLPEAERTEDAKRWLAVAFIAEAGWKAEVDHRGIYHVIKRRWQRRVKVKPKLRFVRSVQLYVAAFDPRTEQGGRVQWLLSLQPGREAPPAGWPKKLSWPKYRVWWKAAQERATRCIDGGRCKDPYPRAWHWGGTIDAPSECMIALPNVGTYNTFYDLDLACRRKSIRKRRAAQSTRCQHRKASSHEYHCNQ